MSVVITVHGTFAGGPDRGNKWWQRGSHFESQVREWVSASNDPVRYEPFQWNGENSETSRRAAGEALAKILSQSSEPTILIGHSHGESVIYHALASAERQKINLDHVKRVITVGTPFLQFSPSRYFFATLGPWGKSLALAAVLVFLILFGGLVSRSFYPESILTTEEYQAVMNQEKSFNAFPSIVGGASALAILILVYWLYKRLQWRRLSQRNNLLERAQERFQARTTCYLHPADEAILGLKAGTERPLEIFQDQFFKPILAGFLLVCPVFLLAIVGLFDTSTDFLYGLFKEFFSLFGVDYQPLHQPHQRNIFSNLDRLGYVLGRPWAVLFGFTGADAASLAITTPIMAMMVAVYVFIISSAIVAVLSLGSRPLSRIFARVSNKVTTQQLLDTSWGNDTIGEICTAANSSPSQTHCVSCTLPHDLADEIQSRSDTALAGSIPQIRTALSKFSSSSHAHDDTVEFWETLNGDELVHNQYFNAPRFNMLLALAIADCDGFTQAAQLKNHQEFGTVAQWHTDIAREAATAKQQSNAQADTNVPGTQRRTLGSWIWSIFVWAISIVVMSMVSLAASTLWAIWKYDIQPEFAEGFARLYFNEIIGNAGIFFLALLVLIFFILRRRRRKNVAPQQA